MSDTPITDEVLLELQHEAPHPTLADHARRLERALMKRGLECHELRAELRQLKERTTKTKV